MLVIYNESEINWQRASVNEKTSKFTASRTLKNGNVRYLDLLTSNGIEVPDIEKFVNMTNCAVLYNGNTSVKFKNKDLKPFITNSDKYNTDIMLINIGLNGKIIKNISGDNTSVIAYLIAKGELFLVVSIRESNDPVNFEVTLHDSHLIADKIYTFTKANNTYNVEVKDVQVDTVIENPTYKINHFRPNKPTHVIFVNDSNYNNMVKHLKYPDSHHIIQFMDNDMEDVECYIDPLKKSGYKAVTMYVNSSEFNPTENKEHGSLYNLLKNNFKFVNILLDNGKTLRR